MASAPPGNGTVGRPPPLHEGDWFRAASWLVAVAAGALVLGIMLRTGSVLCPNMVIGWRAMAFAICRVDFRTCAGAVAGLCASTGCWHGFRRATGFPHGASDLSWGRRGEYLRLRNRLPHAPQRGVRKTP